MKMNTLDHVVVKIVEGPTQIVTDEICCWQVKALVDCYGGVKEEIFRYSYKDYADKIVVGYSYRA